MSYYTKNAKLQPEQLMMLRLMDKPVVTSHDYYNTYGVELRKREGMLEQNKIDRTVGESPQMGQEKKGGIAWGTIASVALPLLAPLVKPLLEKGVKFIGDKITGRGEFDEYQQKLDEMLKDSSSFIPSETQKMTMLAPHKYYKAVHKAGSGIYKKMTTHVFGDTPYAKKLAKKMKSELLPSLKIAKRMKKGYGIYASGSVASHVGHIVAPVVELILKKAHVPINRQQIADTINQFASAFSGGSSVDNSGDWWSKIADVAAKTATAIAPAAKDLAIRMAMKYITPSNIGKIARPILEKAQNLKKKIFGHGVEHNTGVIGYGTWKPWEPRYASRDKYFTNDSDEEEEDEDESEEEYVPKRKPPPRRGGKKKKELFEIL